MTRPPVPDNLRTRIAAAISGVDDWRGVTDPTILADAVIAELGLEPQAHYDPGVAYHRYVTEWARDE